MDAREQPIVIVQPVKCGGAEDRVDGDVRDERREVGADEGHAVTELRQAPPCLLDHVRRAIDRDDVPARQPLREDAGEPTAAAARVDHRLSSFERKTLEDAKSPRELRIGEALVGLGIPFVRCAHDRRAYARCQRTDARRCRHRGDASHAAALPAVTTACACDAGRARVFPRVERAPPRARLQIRLRIRRRHVAPHALASSRSCQRSISIAPGPRLNG